MDILTLIVIACIIIFAYWANNKYSPAPLKTIVNVVLIVIIILGVLSLFGLVPHLGSIRVGR